MRDIVLKASECRRDDSGVKQDSRWRRTNAHRVETHGHQVLGAGVDVENVSAVTAPSRLSAAVRADLKMTSIRPAVDPDAFLAPMQQPTLIGRELRRIALLTLDQLI